MSRHRYEVGALLADYLRAGAGVAICGGLLLFADMLPVVAYLMGFLLLLFGVYGMRTALRHDLTVEVDDVGLATRGNRVSFFDRHIRWAELQGLQMRYFSTRRDRGSGWMQMVLKGEGGAIQVDSHLSAFEDVVRHAYAAAQARELTLNDVTVENLKSLGFALQAES